MKETSEIDLSLAATELPIRKAKSEIKEKIGDAETLIVIGETGSGKTTQLPQILLETLQLGEKIAITQPRRVAATSIANYVAEQVGTKIGDKVGYTIRFDDSTTEGTQINFMTDGILIRKIQEDPLLMDYSIVMIDEVHERSLNIDFSLGLAKKIQKERKERGLKPLKIVVASATLEKEKLIDYFDNAPVVEAPGRLFPVDIQYENSTPHNSEAVVRRAAEKVEQISNQSKEGDILIFMPGKKEIDMVLEALDFRVKSGNFGEALEQLPLYGNQSSEEQNRIFQKGNKRKVIIATNIAETSITVPSVKHVIDSGLINEMEFNTNSGIEALLTKDHAQSGCTQRAGRAGRVSEGTCYRLYTKESFEERNEFQKPELVRTNLAHTILLMKKIGIEDVASFDFLDPPDSQNIRNALDSLTSLGALNAQGSLTEMGLLMAELPLAPNISRMVIESEKYGCTQEVATIASFLGAKPVFVRPRESEKIADEMHSKFTVKNSDFLTMLNVWKQYEKSGFDSRWVRDNFLNNKALQEIEQVRMQLIQILKKNDIEVSDKGKDANPEAVSKSIASGLIENLLEHSGRFNYRKLNVTSLFSSDYFIHPSSVLFASQYSLPELIVPYQIVETGNDERRKKYARTCQVVEPEWIAEIAPHLLEEKEIDTKYDGDLDGVYTKVSFTLKSSSRNFGFADREVTGERAADIFAWAILDGYINIPTLNDNWTKFAEISKLYVKSGKRGDMTSREKLDFYKSRLNGATSLKQLLLGEVDGSINIKVDLDEYISKEEREEISKNSPDTVQVNGKELHVRYYYFEYAPEGQRAVVTIAAPARDILSLESIPVLPSGKVLKIEIAEERYGDAEWTLDDLKTAAKEYLNNHQWEEWKTLNLDVAKKELVSFDPKNPEVSIPEKITYGIDLKSGEELIAYPALSVEGMYSYSRRYSVQYYRTEQEALAAKAKADSAIEEDKNRVEPDYSYIRPSIGARGYGRSFFSEYSKKPVVSDKSTLGVITTLETPELIEEVTELMARKDSKPRRKALLQAVLVGRGPDVLSQTKISAADFPSILEQLRLAKLDAEKQRDYKAVPEIDKASKKVMLMDAFLKAEKDSDYKEYLGDNKDSIARFKLLFWSKLQSFQEVPDDDGIQKVIEQILEEMTS